MFSTEQIAYILKKYAQDVVIHRNEEKILHQGILMFADENTQRYDFGLLEKQCVTYIYDIKNNELFDSGFVYKFRNLFPRKIVVTGKIGSAKISDSGIGNCVGTALLGKTMELTLDFCIYCGTGRNASDCEEVFSKIIEALLLKDKGLYVKEIIASSDPSEISSNNFDNTLDGAYEDYIAEEEEDENAYIPSSTSSNTHNHHFFIRIYISMKW